MKKILIVFGTRPEAIKMVPVIKEFLSLPLIFDTKICVTAQHRQMLDQVLDVFDINPDYDLDVMSPNQNLSDLTSKILLNITPIIIDFNPHIVLVHGDTTTSMAVTLAAFYQNIKIGHIEAGLRTFDLKAPWPEEMNRQITDKLSNYYFAPTEIAKNNLLKENIEPEKIIVTGNTVIDTLFLGREIIRKEKYDSTIISFLKDNGFDLAYNHLDQGRPYILITGHRRENFGTGFLNICNAIKTIAITNSAIDIVYPVHLNPNVQKPVFEILQNLPNVYLLPPLDYLPFLFLMEHSYLILTDSGGIQEEAPSLGKPVLVMRETTERPEAILSGTVRLVGTNYQQIVDNVNTLISDKKIYQKMQQASNPYGDGKASYRIVKYLADIIFDNE